MPSTHLSLLTDAQAGSEYAWLRLVSIYQPWLVRWLHAQGLTFHDAEELTQDVLTVVFRELPSFQHNGRIGGFRRWLREITGHRVLGFWRRHRRSIQSSGGSDFMNRVEELQDESSDLSKQWHADFDRQILLQLLERVANEVEPASMDAFRMLTVDAIPPREVADRLKISVGAVYSAKSRILRRLRIHAAGLIDDEILE